MEGTTLEVEKNHKEETGEDRTDRVTKIKSVREAIANLSAATLSVDENTLKAARAHLYRRLLPLVPYSNQMANADILRKGSPGWERTCNISVVAASMEALGKDTSAFTGEIGDIKLILGALDPARLKDQHDNSVSDLEGIRMADFMQLVAIYREMKDKDWEHKNAQDKDGIAKFEGAVAGARKKAAQHNTVHAAMIDYAELMGATVQQKWLTAYDEELEDIGLATRLRRQIPKLEDQIAKLEAKENRTAKQEADLKEKKAELANKKTGLEALDKKNDPAKYEELVPLGKYKQSVLKTVAPALNEGKQLWVGLEQHFVYLEAVGDEQIVVDDPGTREGKSRVMTWTEARNNGYFKTYFIVQ
jgi:hypothetical protein